MWRKKPENWLKVNKDGEERLYINDFGGSFLSSFLLMGTPTLFLIMHLCLASILTKQIDKLFLCVPPPTCCYAVPLIINFVPAFTVLAFMINVFFHWWQRSREK